MRVNIYAEELTNNVTVVRKEADGHKYVGFRLFLHLPVTINPDGVKDRGQQPSNVVGPFLHRKGDDDSSAVTFWVEEKEESINTLHTIFHHMLTKAYDAMVGVEEEIQFPPSGPEPIDQ